MTSDLTEAQLQTLLRWAAQCVDAAVGERDVPSRPESAELGEIGGGVFITLRHEDDLAGCIGYVEAPPPLTETVRRAAQAAVLHDVRFELLRPEELTEVQVELSILSVPVRIDAEQLRVGHHGAILRWQGREGLLLPQVATEYGLERDAFLVALCDKSGVPRDTLQREDCEILAFTVQKTQGDLTDLLVEATDS